MLQFHFFSYLSETLWHSKATWNSSANQSQERRKKWAVTFLTVADLRVSVLVLSFFFLYFNFLVRIWHFPLTLPLLILAHTTCKRVATVLRNKSSFNIKSLIRDYVLQIFWWRNDTNGIFYFWDLEKLESKYIVYFEKLEKMQPQPQFPSLCLPFFFSFLKSQHQILSNLLGFHVLNAKHEKHYG